MFVCYKMGAQVPEARFLLQNGLYKMASASQKKYFTTTYSFYTRPDPSHFIGEMATRILLSKIHALVSTKLAKPPPGAGKLSSKPSCKGQTLFQLTLT